MKKEIFIEVAVYALFILFVYASLNKLFAFDLFLSDLKDKPLLKPFAYPISVLAPVSELIVAGMLLFQRSRFTGFLGSAILMTAFTAYITFALAVFDSRPCSCGGIIKHLTWPQHLVFNIFFLLISISGIVLQKNNHKRTMHSNLT